MACSVFACHQIRGPAGELPGAVRRIQNGQDNVLESVLIDSVAFHQVASDLANLWIRLTP